MIPSFSDLSIRIVEVGPRDGLQNEPTVVPASVKVALIQKLVEAGLRDVEVTSFVHPRLVPQLADAAEVLARVVPVESVRYSALVPNEKGLDRALAAGIRRIAVLTAASETFNRKNINMGVDESLGIVERVVSRARKEGMSVRGYVSTAFVCPFEGAVDETRVRVLVQRLVDLGVEEVAISDTIGAAAPTDVHKTVGHVLESVSPERLALHVHDTYGTALANVLAGLHLGVRVFDASVGGLGGCPFAPGAAGNLATEDLVYMLERMGFRTGVHLAKLIEAAAFIGQAVGHELPSRQLRRAQCSRPEIS